MFWKVLTLPNDTMGSLTERALSEARTKDMPVRFEFNGNLFEANPAPEGYGVVQQIGEYGAFLEDEEKEVMGGNYSEFPYRIVDRERERYMEREERKVRRDAKWADFQSIENDRMAALKAKVEEERLNNQPAMVMKSRSLGVTALANNGLMTRLALWNNPLLFMESTSKGLTSENVTTWSTYGGISRGPQTAEDRLAVVRDVLLQHLRFQLQRAPSMESTYANDVNLITASDIQRVVQALEGEPAPQILPQSWGMGVDFAAEASDGNKIIIEKRFQSGVIFDPANRPIRKFRLKEEAAS